jgi:hypothetical protein
MSCDKKKTSAVHPIVRLLAALPLLAAALFVSPAALAVDSGDIVVVSTKGEVHFTVNGAPRNVRAGGVLELPATLRTGDDGAVELKQGATTVSVGPKTVLEFPALEKRGAPIDRILQPSGNAFYNIGKREGRRLRIETPYLVGVIKGTQFNVAVQDDATTISLFEGLLEVRTADDSDAVDLKAGEIASRKRGDKSISVLKMDAGKAPPTGPRAPAGSSSGNGMPSPATPRVNPPDEGGESLLVNHAGGAAGTVGVVVDTPATTGASLGVNASPVTGDEVGASAAVNPGDMPGVAANAAISTGISGIDVTAGTRIDAAGVAVDAGAGVDLGGGSVDVTAGTNVAAGPVTVDSGAAVDLGGDSLDVSTSANASAGPVEVATGAALNLAAAADLTTTTTVDAGPVTADVGANISVDPGAGAVDTSATAGVAAGALTTDLGAAAGADLGAGTVGTTVSVGASAPGVTVDVGAATALDAAAGTVNLGLNIAGTDLSLGLDLGLDDDGNNGHGNDAGGSDPGNPGSQPAKPPVIDVGGLLNGLLRRPGRK